MQKFTNQDLLSDFRNCESEIVSLRNRNKELSIEVNAMNRVLHAVNSHVEERKGLCATEDIIYEIRGTIKFLEDTIKNESDDRCKECNNKPSDCTCDGVPSGK